MTQQEIIAKAEELMELRVRLAALETALDIMRMAGA